MAIDPEFAGDGYLAGEFPGGTTTVNNVPTSASVRVLFRDPAEGARDGEVVARTTSAADGTWQVLGVDPDKKFDIVGRLSGYNDVIQADISPIPLYIISTTGGFTLGGSSRTLEGSLLVSGGLPPYTITIDSGAPPAGWTFYVDGRHIRCTGNATESGDFSWTFKIESSNGAELLVPITIDGVVGITYYDLVMGLEPVCYLRMDETSGTTATDSSGNGNHGTYSVDASTITAAGLLESDDNYGIDIAAKGPYITLATTPINTAASWTVGIIIRPDSVPTESGSGTLFQIGGDDGERPLITFANITGTDGLVFIGRSGGSQPFLGAERFTYGSKMVLFFTHSPNEGMRMIVNNHAQGYAAQVFGSFTGATRIGISKYGSRDPEYPFIGAMDEAVFFNKVLTDDQITELTNAVYAAPQELGRQVLLLHMEGTDGSEDFEDSSQEDQTCFVDGPTHPKISTDFSVVGSSSAEFFGAGYAGTAPSRDYDFGTGEFTLMGYVRMTAYSANYGSAGYGSTLFASYRGAGDGPPRGWQVRINGTASAFNTVYIYTGSNEITFPYNFALDTTYHITISRKKGVVDCKVNGKSIGRVLNGDNFSGSITSDLVNNVSSPRELLIGGLNDSLYRLYLTGYMDEIEFNKGWCLHPVDFDPSDGQPLSSTFRDLVLASQPFMYYRLNEASGSIMYDSASMARNGVYALPSGTPISYAVDSLVGDYDKAVGLTGGWVRSAGLISFPCDVFTLSCVVKLDSGITSRYIAGIAQEADATNSSGAKDRCLYVGPDGKLHFYIYDGIQRFLVSPDVINDGQTHILHVTVGAGSTQLYIDGEQVATGSFVGTALYGGYLFGGHNVTPVESGTTLSNMTGTLDELAWYNTKLSADQVMAQAVAAGLASP